MKRREPGGCINPPGSLFSLLFAPLKGGPDDIRLASSTHLGIMPRSLVPLRRPLAGRVLSRRLRRLRRPILHAKAAGRRFGGLWRRGRLLADLESAARLRLIFDLWRKVHIETKQAKLIGRGIEHRNADVAADRHDVVERHVETLAGRAGDGWSTRDRKRAKDRLSGRRRMEREIAAREVGERRQLREDANGNPEPIRDATVPE